MREPVIRGSSTSKINDPLGGLDMADGRPVDDSDPIGSIGVVMDERIGLQLTTAAFVVLIIGVKREPQALTQFDPLPLQVVEGSLARQPQTVGVVEVLEVGINFRAGTRKEGCSASLTFIGYVEVLNLATSLFLGRG